MPQPLMPQPQSDRDTIYRAASALLQGEDGAAKQWGKLLENSNTNTVANVIVEHDFLRQAAGQNAFPAAEAFTALLRGKRDLWKEVRSTQARAQDGTPLHVVALHGLPRKKFDKWLQLWPVWQRRTHEGQTADQTCAEARRTRLDSEFAAWRAQIDAALAGVEGKLPALRAAAQAAARNPATGESPSEGLPRLDKADRVRKDAAEKWAGERTINHPSTIPEMAERRKYLFGTLQDFALQFLGKNPKLIDAPNLHQILDKAYARTGNPPGLVDAPGSRLPAVGNPGLVLG